MIKQKKSLVRLACAAVSDWAQDLLFPPTCPGCRQFVSHPGGVCAACWRDLRFITKPYCPIMGTPFSYDAGPDILSGEAIQNPPPFARARAVLVHDGLARSLVTCLKYGDQTHLAPTLAQWMVHAAADILAESDCIIPVPLHHWRFLKRHYNQAAELARHIAAVAHKPFCPEGLKRVRRTRQQVGLNARQRELNVKNAFLVPDAQKAKLKNQSVVLIDDVYTTGATIKAAAMAVKRAGAARVDVLTFSRVLSSD